MEQSLPYDVFFEIARHLPPRSKLHLSLGNKTLFALLYNEILRDNLESFSLIHKRSLLGTVIKNDDAEHLKRLISLPAFDLDKIRGWKSRRDEVRRMEQVIEFCIPGGQKCLELLLDWNNGRYEFRRPAMLKYAALFENVSLGVEALSLTNPGLPLSDAEKLVIFETAKSPEIVCNFLRLGLLGDAAETSLGVTVLSSCIFFLRGQDTSEVIQMLALTGVDINIPVHSPRRTALDTAAETINCGALASLIKLRPNPLGATAVLDIEETAGMTPLHILLDQNISSWLQKNQPRWRHCKCKVCLENYGEWRMRSIVPEKEDLMSFEARIELVGHQMLKGVGLLLDYGGQDILMRRDAAGRDALMIYAHTLYKFFYFVYKNMLRGLEDAVQQNEQRPIRTDLRPEQVRYALDRNKKLLTPSLVNIYNLLVERGAREAELAGEEALCQLVSDAPELLSCLSTLAMAKLL